MFFPDLVHHDGRDEKDHVGDHLSNKGPQNEFSNEFGHQVHEERPNRQDIQDLRWAKFDNQVSQILKISDKAIAQVMFFMMLQALSHIVVGDDAVKADGGHGRPHKGR